MTPAELDAIEYAGYWVQDNMRALISEVRRLRAEKAPRIVAVLGGGDWSDASVSHIRVPPGLDLKALEKEHRELRRKHTDEYGEFSRWMADKLAAKRMTGAEHNQAIKEWFAAHPRPPDFSDWLVANHGAESVEIEETGDEPC